MNITKDESRILAAALGEFKYQTASKTDKTLASEAFRKLTSLEEKLEEFGKDKRRTGRTSQDDWSDLMRRFVNS